MLARRTGIAAASSAALVLLLAGCGSAGSAVVDAAKSKAGSAVAAAACEAIPSAQAKVDEMGTVDPATLDKVNSAVQQVQASLAALGDKIPAAVKTQFDDASASLNQAITDAKADPSKAQAAVTTAQQKLTESLTALSTNAGC
jgi:mRNA-degrading endonuclease toxin of MazEF toxin-antitoxin module